MAWNGLESLAHSAGFWPFCPSQRFSHTRLISFNHLLSLVNLFSSSSLETWSSWSTAKKKASAHVHYATSCQWLRSFGTFFGHFDSDATFCGVEHFGGTWHAVGNASCMTGSLGNLTVSQKRPSMPFKESRSVQKTLQNGCLNEVVAYNSFPQDTSGLQSPREIASTGNWGVLDPVVHTFASELSTHLGSHTDEIALTLGGWSWCRDLLTVISGRLDGFYRLRIVLYIYTHTHTHIYITIHVLRNRDTRLNTHNYCK